MYVGIGSGCSTTSSPSRTLGTHAPASTVSGASLQGEGLTECPIMGQPTLVLLILMNGSVRRRLLRVSGIGRGAPFAVALAYLLGCDVVS